MATLQELMKPESAKEYVLKVYGDEPEHFWGLLHQGMICAHAGHPHEAANFFEKFIAYPDNRSWVHKEKEFAVNLLNRIFSPNEFKAYVCQNINLSRQLKKLPVREFKFM